VYLYRRFKICVFVWEVQDWFFLMGGSRLVSLYVRFKTCVFDGRFKRCFFEWEIQDFFLSM
jgi:hypothetical protein